MNIEQLLYTYLNEKKWSQKVQTSFHPPEGTFSKSPEEIIKALSSDGADYKTVMSRLNFFLNRAGKNVSDKVESNVETAKKILMSKHEKDKEE